MRLVLDISKTTFTVTRGAMERLDDNGRQRMDRNTKLPMWSVQVMALDESGGEVLNVTVVGDAPKVNVGSIVTPVGLEAIPWVQGNRNGTAFRAVSLSPMAGSKPQAA